jgi:phosphate transport system permease protein
MQATDSSAIASAAGPIGAPVSLKADRVRWGERLIVAFVALCALVSVVTTLAIVASLVPPTVEFFGEVGLSDFLFGKEWAPLFNPPSFGVLPVVVGTLVTTFWALLVCLPFGLGAAIYLSEYARPRIRAFAKPALEILAGIPTVVYGFFALTFLAPILQDVWFVGEAPSSQQFALVAGLVMGIMIIPTVASLSEDAMAAVPNSLRQAAYALGASKLTVSTRIVVPAALSGIVASFVLAISRAIGETMIVLIAAGSTPNLSFDPRDAVQTMTSFIASTGIGDVATGSTAYKTLFAVGSLLFVATFVMNIISIRLVRRYREVYE